MRTTTWDPLAAALAPTPFGLAEPLSRNDSALLSPDRAPSRRHGHDDDGSGCAC